MASSFVKHLLGRVSFYFFAIFNWFLFLGLSIKTGTFFTRDSEQDKLQYAIGTYARNSSDSVTDCSPVAERDRFWNLTKEPLPGFKHNFYTLRNGLKLHYISNRLEATTGSLVIFIHGFPDSSMMWRHLLQEPAIPRDDATLVCVDLPGYGGSDSLKQYDTEVLEALTEFVVAMRDKYLPEDSDDNTTFIVGHDWGCVLGFRFAAEAPSLADRFILTNAPHVSVRAARF
jgi:pimeloyl-ACP methyl ester carboxylesterase